jgi:hypothetical protein
MAPTPLPDVVDCERKKEQTANGTSRCVNTRLGPRRQLSPFLGERLIWYLGDAHRSGRIAPNARLDTQEEASEV